MLYLESIHRKEGIHSHVTKFCINSKTIAQKTDLLCNSTVFLLPINQPREALEEFASPLNLESC